jgi:hypothetical protein
VWRAAIVVGAHHLVHTGGRRGQIARAVTVPSRYASVPLSGRGLRCLWRARNLPTVRSTGPLATVAPYIERACSPATIGLTLRSSGRADSGLLLGEHPAGAPLN